MSRSGNIMTKSYDRAVTLSERMLVLLKNSPYWTPRTRLTDVTLHGLVCPVCGDQTAWAYTREPFAINCNRQNHCGARTKTMELFPELRRNFDRDFAPTKADPKRPCREYLRSRGLPDAVVEGLAFWYLQDARNTGSGAIMFPLGKDSTGKDAANGRLFNEYPGQGKTHNIGSTSGLYWRHPGMTYDSNRKTFITEGILDALSLIALGEQAIAVLASGQDPGKLDLTEFKYKVLSFDNDPAGHNACRKWKEFYPEAETILCDAGQDWNDLLQSRALDQVIKHFKNSLPRFRINGDLALADNADHWADIFHGFHGFPPGLFTFKRETYFATLKASRGGDHATCVSVSRCLRGTVKVISYIIDRSNPARPEFLYNLEIQPSQQGRRSIEITATGKDIASARSMNEFFLTSGKLNWEGDARAATALQSKITGDKKAPEVCQLSVIGYQPANGVYIFHNWAVDVDGRLIVPDKRSHFRIGHNHYFRPPAHSESKAITPAVISKEQVREIYRLIREAWGMNGTAVLSWAVAGFFCNQVKEKTNWFPFLSLHGDPASGKSALVTLINNIQGREGEGLPVTQLNSKKGSIRTIGQLSGLFTALLEDNERNERGFDYSIILTAYNRGPLQVQAAFSNDLQTRENPFLGTLLFCQNNEPFNSKAEKQRTISLHFKAESITDASRAAYDKLMTISRQQLAGILQQVLVHRLHFEKNWCAEYETARRDLGPMTERRIIDNHALILAFYRLFCSCFDIKDDPATTLFFAETGRQKCITSAIRQTTIADHFFELLDTIEDDKAAVCYHIDANKGCILVNLPKVENILRNKGLSFQANEPLNIALQKHPSFIRNGMKYRFPKDTEVDGTGRIRQRKVWVFSLEWHKNNHVPLNDAPRHPGQSHRGTLGDYQQTAW